MYYIGFGVFAFMTMAAPFRMASGSWYSARTDEGGSSVRQGEPTPAAERYEKWKQSALAPLSGGSAHSHTYVCVTTQRLDDGTGIVKLAIAGTSATRMTCTVKPIFQFDTGTEGVQSQQDISYEEIGPAKTIIAGMTPGVLAERELTFAAVQKANGMQVVTTLTDKDGSTDCNMTIFATLDGKEDTSIASTIVPDPD